MYAGHFAPVPLLSKYYPDISPFVLTFGVVFLDLVFASLSFFGIEGFSLNPGAGVLGADIHCNYSHSLLGSVVLSLVYAVLTKSHLPGFLASFSHFAGDWLVHDLDLALDPFSNIMVGGTMLWLHHPRFSYYMELGLCIVLGFFGPGDNTTNLYSTLFLVAIHIVQASISPPLFKQILSLPTSAERQHQTFIGITTSFCIPALVLGYLLSRKSNRKNKMN